MLTRTQKIAAIGAALILVIGGSFALWYLQNNDTGPGFEITDIEGLPEGATVEIVDRVNEQLFQNTPRPALDRSLPRGGASEQVYQVMLKQRSEAVSMIEENPALMTQWIGLGALHKQAMDYEGARIYWNYVATVNPQNLAVHWNLGNLYAYYLKDMGKAEASFMKAIAIDPSFIPAYAELYTVRKEQGKGELAVEILISGIAKNPADTDLRVMLARHYRDARDIPKAKEAYDAAIAAAEKANNTSLVTSLQAEKAAL